MAHCASVVSDPAITMPKQLVEAIRAAGYDAVLPRSDGSSAEAPADALSRIQRKAVSSAKMRPLCCLERLPYLILMKMVAKVNRVRDSMKARPRIISS